MYKLWKWDAYNLIKWSSIYSAWGAIPYSKQKFYIDQYYNKNKSVDIHEINDFDWNAFFVSLWWMWSSDTATTDISPMFKEWLWVYEKYTWKKIEGIYACETGIEWIIIKSIPELWSKLLDADRTWWRAIPKIFYSNFFISDKSIFPVIAIDKNLKAYIYDQDDIDLTKLEEKLREITIKTDWPIAIVDHWIVAEKAKEILTHWVIKRNIAMWEKINQKKNQEFVQWISYTWRVESVTLSKKNWFLVWKIQIESDANQLEIYVRNENMIITSKGLILHQFPETISIFDLQSRVGIHNTLVEKEAEIVIYVEWPSELRKPENNPKHEIYMNENNDLLVDVRNSN